MGPTEKYFPAFLDLKGKDCLVVGGGPVGRRKAQQLLAAGARVTLISPEVIPGRLLRNLTVRRKRFEAKDLASGRRGPWLVVAASNDPALNRRVSETCRARRLWANVVDAPGLCGFIFPSVFRRGPVTFAISTGGASPALAKRLRKGLQKRFGPEVGEMARMLAKLRKRLKGLDFPRRRRIFDRLLKP